MKMKTRLLLLFLILANSCTLMARRLEYDSLKNQLNNIKDEQKRYEILFNQAKTNSNSNIEYALDCAYEANKIAIKNEDLYKQGETNIVMGEIFINTKAYLTAINYFENAIDYFEKLDNYEKINKLYIELAKLYHLCEFDFEWSLEAMKEASYYANKLDINKSYVNTYLTYGNLFMENNEDSLAIQYYDMALSYPLNGCTIKDISTALSKKASILIKHRKYDEAMAMIDSSLYMSIRDFNDELTIINYSLKGDIYDSLQQYDKAKTFYIKATDISYSIKDYEKCVHNILKLGFQRKQLKEYEEAIKIFTILCDSAGLYKWYEETSLSYLQLSECYNNLGKYEEAYKNHILYDTYRDSAMYEKNTNNNTDLRNKYILSEHLSELDAKEMELQNLKQKRYNYIFTIVTSFSVMMLIITYIILYSHNRMLKHKNIEAEYQQTIELEKIEKNIIELQLKNSKKSLVNLAFLLKSYMEFISPIKDELKESMELPYEEIKSKVRSVYLNIQNNINLFSEMEGLQEQIDAIYEDFLSKIENKYPDLTKSEKRLCAMLYIDMSSKEISIITNTTVRSVETSRYRLRKKFNIETDDDIVDFLRNMS